MTRQKTHEEYVAELKEKNPNVEVLEEYCGRQKKILHRCLICGYEWKVVPGSILSGCGCPVCGFKRCVEKHTKTHEQYVEEVKTINPNIEVLGYYQGACVKILHRCLIDGYEWMVTPHNILRGKGCPKCANNARYTTETYIKAISEKNPDIELIGEFKNVQTKTLHRCKIHNVIWNAFPSNVLKGHKCRECQKEMLVKQNTKSKEQYILDLEEHESDIIVLGDYVNAHVKILHKCNKCGTEWYATPNDVLSGRRCPSCNQSIGERQVEHWLRAHHIKYELQKKFETCRYQKELPFDFYLPELNVCIEYQGEQHYRVVNFFGGEKGFIERQRNDNIKRKFCKDNDIRLLEIPFDKDVDEELSNFLFI